jgi:hypothetical protein
MFREKPSAKNFSYEQLTDAVMQEYTLIINATPLGMYPNVVEAPQIPYHALGPQHYLYDLLYNPEKDIVFTKRRGAGAHRSRMDTKCWFCRRKKAGGYGMMMDNERWAIGNKAIGQ